MAVPNLIRAAGNEFVTTLATGVSSGDTSMQLNSVTGLSSSGGTLIIDEGSASEERVYYESIAGNIITIATGGRGLYGTSAVAHSSGATVTDILVDAHINNIITQFKIGHSDAGLHTDTSLATLTGTQTLTNKTLTTPKIASIYQDAGATNLLTLPAATDTLVGKATTDTLTNKTLTTPVLELANTSPTADGGIGFDRTNENLQIGDGTNSQKVHMGVWTTFTPSVASWTVGNGSVSGAYTIIGKTCSFWALLTAGTTSAITGAMTLTLPVTARVSMGNIIIIGNVHIYDASGSLYPGILWSNGVVKLENASGTYLVLNDTANNTPMTVTSGDFVTMSGTYEIA